MTGAICGLLIKFQPKAFVKVRQTLENWASLINKKTNWQEDGNMVMALILNRPDTDDEGRNTSFDWKVEGMIKSLKEARAEVQERRKTPPLPPPRSAGPPAAA